MKKSHTDDNDNDDNYWRLVWSNNNKTIKKELNSIKKNENFMAFSTFLSFFLSLSLCLLRLFRALTQHHSLKNSTVLLLLFLLLLLLLWLLLLFSLHSRSHQSISIPNNTQQKNFIVRRNINIDIDHGLLIGNNIIFAS